MKSNNIYSYDTTIFTPTLKFVAFNLSLIEEIINAGYYFSINEAMTTSISGKKIISKIPPNRILTETDAPFNKHSNILNAIFLRNM